MAHHGRVRVEHMFQSRELLLFWGGFFLDARVVAHGRAFCPLSDAPLCLSPNSRCIIYVVPILGLVGICNNLGRLILV
jgi:hypothetical protein